MKQDRSEWVHDRPETEAEIKKWDESGITCSPMIGRERTEDGHVVSYVRQLGPHAWDVRMSCPDEGKMSTEDSVTFTCKHGGFDAEELIGMKTWPAVDMESWPTMDRGRP